MWTKLCLTSVLALVLLVNCHAWGETPVKWESNLEFARQQAATTNRLLLVHFWAPWCSACRKMEQEVLSHPAVHAAIDADYVPVRLNVDHNRTIAQQFGISSLPTDVVVSPDGRLLERQPGFMERHQYVARLRQIAMDARRPPAAVSGVQPSGSTPITENAPPHGPGPAAPPSWSSGPPAANQRFSAPVASIPSGGPSPSAMAPEGVGRSAPNSPSTPRTQPPPADPPLAATPARPAPPNDPNACPFVMDGFCPVELVENKVWKLGDVRWGVNHRGRTYLFSGPEQQQRFLQAPDRYSPVESGIDVVLAITKEQIVPGRREYGVFCANRVFLFANEDSLAAFSAEPERYLERLQSFNQAPQGTTYR